ncbi:hypothetical protein TNCV_5020891 [Trichonephila clavipes]|nr:hypothetical protein TNCV_5020891 [Trichonephila clavipes]
MNQASVLVAQMQQHSLSSSLEDTFGSLLVHLGGQLLNGSTSIRLNTSTAVVHFCHLWPLVHHICHITDFGQSHFAMHSILLPLWDTNSLQT